MAKKQSYKKRLVKQILKENRKKNTKLWQKHQEKKVAARIKRVATKTKVNRSDVKFLADNDIQQYILYAKKNDPKSFDIYNTLEDITSDSKLFIEGTEDKLINEWQSLLTSDEKMRFIASLGDMERKHASGVSQQYQEKRFEGTLGKGVTYDRKSVTEAVQRRNERKKQRKGFRG